MSVLIGLGGVIGQLRQSEIIGALSHALDLTEGMPAGHAQRCCWIGMHLAREMDIDATARDDLYYTLLLKDAGCSSNAARIYNIYQCDDRLLKRDYKLLDGSRVDQLVKFAIAHVAPGLTWLERLPILARLAGKGEEIGQELFLTRCEQGAEIAEQLGFSATVCDAIRGLDEHWDGSGFPRHARDTDIPLFSRIALLSQVVEVFFAEGGVPSALQAIRARSGRWFDPQLVEQMERLARDESFWDGLRDPDIASRIVALQPPECVREVSAEELARLSGAFAAVIDAKSPYTLGHSSRVCQYAERIGREVGLAEPELFWLRQAALLHDIGKLGISNRILDKPGKLTDAEFEEIKRHPVYSLDILSKIGVFDSLAPVASAHHERLDGKGYPFGLKGSQIDAATRMIAVADVFDAISAERPYRGAMPLPQALAILDEMSGSALDGDYVAALKRSL